METLIENCNQGKNVFIGKYSIVKNSSIGDDTKIWHYCNIYGTPEQFVNIGKNTQIGSYSEIKAGVVIGNNCRIQSYVFIPEGIVIEDYVFIGPRVVFTNDKYPSAIKTIQKTWVLEKTNVQTHVSIGAGAVIAPGVTLEKCSIIGMGAVVIRDVPPYAIVCGNPAVIIGYVHQPKYAKKFSELLEELQGEYK